MIGPLVVAIAASCSAGPTTIEGPGRTTRQSPPTSADVPAVVDIPRGGHWGTLTPTDPPPEPVTGSRMVVGSTPGTIACGKEDCRVGDQVCCYTIGDRIAYCEPGSLEGYYCPVRGKRPAGALIRCDDRQDCPAGEVCCLHAEGDYRFYSCAPRPCETAEVCVGAKGCSEDHRCDLESTDDELPHLCRYVDPKVSCDGALCKGDTPVCCRAPDQKSWRCVAPGREACGTFRYECATNADCAPGYRCCVTSHLSYCTAGCGAHAWAACRTVSDCPTVINQKPKKCTHGNGPPELKDCDY